MYKDFRLYIRTLGLPSTDDSLYKDKVYYPKKSIASQLLDAWKKGQKYLDLFFRNVWRIEYLLSLKDELPI